MGGCILIDGLFRYYDASKGALTREGITLKVLAAATAASLGS